MSSVVVSCPGCRQVCQATPGIVVACPACGMHMQAPGSSPNSLSPQPPSVVTGYPSNHHSYPVPGGANQSVIWEIQSILPHENETRIAGALQHYGGDKEATINGLLNNQDPPQPTSAPSSSGQHESGVVGGPPPQLSGRRKALLVGINYPGTRAQLRGCVNDVKKMKEFLLYNNWRDSRETMVVLTDDQRDPNFRPTKQNILNAMRWLCEGSHPGDILFFHFSGHGAQQADPTGVEEDGMDETIVPSDYKTAGQITDNEIFRIMVFPLQNGVRLTAIMDCCHSGTGMDLPWTLQHRGGRLGWTEDTNPCHTLGDVQLFSGCEDGATSADSSRYGVSGGAMTTAFIDTLRENPHHTYISLMDGLHRNLRKLGFPQLPQLTTTQRFDLNRPFSLYDIHPNMNPVVHQQIMRRRINRRRRPRNNRVMNDLGIGGAGMAVGGGLLAGLIGMSVLDSMF